MDLSRLRATLLTCPMALAHRLTRLIHGKDVARVLELPDVKQRMQNIGFTPAPTTPDEYDKIVRSQVRMFSEIAKDVGLIPK